MAVHDIVHQSIKILHSVERDLRLRLKHLQGLRKLILLEKLQHQPHHVCGLDLHLLHVVWLIRQRSVWLQSRNLLPYVLG